jgi:hypothetical protein
MHNVAAFSAFFAYDCTLSARINKSLNWAAVDFSFYVQHGNLTKKFWTILERCLVVRLYHVFTNFFFNLFLRFSVVWVCIVKFQDSFLVGFLFVK